MTNTSPSFTTPCGLTVDLSTASIAFRSSWSSEVSERFGAKHDIVVATLTAKTITGTIFDAVLSIRSLAGKTLKARAAAKITLTALLENELATLRESIA